MEEPTINDEKLRALSDKLALFSEHGAISEVPAVPPHWSVTVPPFQPSTPEMGPLNQHGFGVPHQQLLPDQPFHLPSDRSFGITSGPVGPQVVGSVSHQRVPSLGHIDSETNPIAASLLMSFKSGIAEGEPASAAPRPAKPTTTGQGRRGGLGHRQHHHQHQQQIVLPQTRHNFYANQVTAPPHHSSVPNKKPPPPPPPQVPMADDAWVTCLPRGHSTGGRLKFSDVVKKSLHEVEQPKSGQAGSRPLTPAPSSSPSNEKGSIGASTPSSSNFSMSRNGKPIVIAKVEPMQMSVSRIQNVVAPTVSPQSPTKSTSDTKIRRTRSSTSGAASQTADGSVPNSASHFGSKDSVFGDVAAHSGDVATKRSSRAFGRAPKSSWSIENLEGRNEDDSERDDDVHSEMDSRQGHSDVEPTVRPRSQRSKAKKAPKRGAKSVGTGKSRSSLFMQTLWGWLTRFGSWLVILLATIGSFFRFILRKIFQALAVVVAAVVRGFRQVHAAAKKMLPSKPQRPERNMSYMALLRLYGLPRPVPLPISADLTLKRLVQLQDADAYTILGCHVDAKQDDINVRLRQLARLLTQNHKKSQQLEEANATFRRVCNDVGSREARQRYDCELAASAELLLRRQAALRNRSRREGGLFDTSIANMLAFQCADCGLAHQLLEVVERRPEQARQCHRCASGQLHAAENGDLWSESWPSSDSSELAATADPWSPGVRYLACLQLMAGSPPGIYDVSDTVVCCRSRMPSGKLKVEPHSHTSNFRIELEAKMDEEGYALQKFPNPTAVRDGEYDWPALQVYQVCAVPKHPQRDGGSSVTHSNSQSTRRGRRKGH